MWRPYWLWKRTTSIYSKTLNIKGLKSFLNNNKEFQSWTYWWTKNWKDNWNISIDMTKWETNWYIRVYFTQTSMDWIEKKLDYKINLVSTPCNYWWVRWWFECPCKWNRCSILYLQNNWIFASRKTLDLVYDQQKESKRSRYLWFVMWEAFTKIEKIRRTMKYPVRNWKWTKKALRIIKLKKKMPSEEEIKRMWEVLWRD